MHGAIDQKIGCICTAVIHIKATMTVFMHYLKIFKAFYHANMPNYFRFKVGVVNEC